MTTLPILYSGGRLESVVNVIGSPADLTSGGQYDATYADACLNVPLTASVDTLLYDSAMSPITAPNDHTYYLHFDAYNDFFGGGGAVLTMFDSSGHPWVRILGDTASTGLLVQYNSGTGGSPVWTTIGSATISANHVLQTWDLSVFIDPAGTAHVANLYLNGVLVGASSGTFSAAGFSDFAKITWANVNNSRSTSFSQMLVTQDTPTIGAHVKTIRASGAGHYTAWTGAYTDVNEPLDNDSTYNKSTTVGDEQSYTMGDVTVPSGYAIASVFYWLRANEAGGAPANVKALLRTGSTDFVSGDLAGIGLGFGAIGNRYDVDPNTSAVWTQSGFNAYEMGFESAT